MVEGRGRRGEQERSTDSSARASLHARRPTAETTEAGNNNNKNKEEFAKARDQCGSRDVGERPHAFMSHRRARRKQGEQGKAVTQKRDGAV